MVFEAASYLADHDRVAMERLLETGTLLTAIGEREEAAEERQQEQPQLPGMG
jgi:hypothetical protein